MYVLDSLTVAVSSWENVFKTQISKLFWTCRLDIVNDIRVSNKKYNIGNGIERITVQKRAKRTERGVPGRHGAVMHISSELNHYDGISLIIRCFNSIRLFDVGL